MRKIIILFILLFSVTAYSQWTKVNVPDFGSVNSVKKISGYLFAISDSNGVYRSSDNGLSWLESNTGFPILNIKVYCRLRI